MPKAVSKAPVIAQQPWDPVLGDSVHAFAWWTLSKEETVAVIQEQKSRSSKRPASQFAEQPPATKRIQSPKGSVAKTPTTASKTGANPPPSKETSKAKAEATTAPVIPSVEELVLPLPELTGPPGQQQPSSIEYRGNAGIREPSQARGKRSSKPHASRISHLAATVAGKGTPSVPPVEAVGAYSSDSLHRPIVPQSQDLRETMKGSSGDRSRSRDPPRETTAAVPIAQPQAVMTLPSHVLPIMVRTDVGPVSLDQPATPNVSGMSLPKAPPENEPSIREFFETFHQAQDHEAQMRAVREFKARLMGELPMSESPVSREGPDTSRPLSVGGSGERMPSPHPPKHAASAVSTETSPGRVDSTEAREDVAAVASESAPAERGRQTSVAEKLRSYWPRLRSLTGSDRRPRSPTMPPRPKPEPTPKRSASMPKVSDSALTGSTSSTTPSATTNPITIVPAVQIPAPVAIEQRPEPPAPEVTSDAETLALPGLPGATGEENVPSPVEEEVVRTMDDPYVSAGDGLASEESPPVETAQEAVPTQQTAEVTVKEFEGFGGLRQIIPIPKVSDVIPPTTKSVSKPADTASTKGGEAATSEPAIPTVQPSEAAASKPPSGEAAASEPPSGEAEASKPPSGEGDASKPQEGEKKTDNPETAPKPKAKSVSTRKPKETPKETPEQKEKREKAEKIAEELVQQEAKEKMKQAAKDAKSKKAAAENTEKAREAAAQQRKEKEQAAEAEQTPAQKRRIKAATPANDPVDEPPPPEDDQPWEIYHYRPHVEVDATLVYEEEERGVKHYDLESAYNLDIRGTRPSFTHGQDTTVSEPVKVLQNGNRRVREIRAEQLERLAASKPIVPVAPHPCVVKGGLLMRVSIPYHKNGKLMLGTFPGMTQENTTWESSISTTPGTDHGSG